MMERWGEQQKGQKRKKKSTFLGDPLAVIDKRGTERESYGRAPTKEFLVTAFTWEPAATGTKGRIGIKK